MQDPLSIIQPLFVGTGQAFGLLGLMFGDDGECRAPRVFAPVGGLLGLIFAIPVAACVKIALEKLVLSRAGRLHD